MSTLVVGSIVNMIGSAPSIPGMNTGYNMIINGEFNINDHIDRTSPVTSTGYITDRWSLTSGSGSTTYSYDQVNKPEGSNRSLLLDGPGTLRQAIEIPGLAQAGQFTVGSVFTISLWSDRSLVGESLPCAITDTVSSISGGNSNTNTPGTFAAVPDISSSNGFTKYYANITIDATPSATSRCFAFALPDADGLGGPTRFSMIQFETGSVATPFKHRFLSEETQLASRYYQLYTSLTASITRDSGTLGQNKVVNVPMRNVMRVPPTVTYSENNFTGPGSSSTAIASTIQSVRIVSSDATPGGTSTLTNIELDAEL